GFRAVQSRTRLRNARRRYGGRRRILRFARAAAAQAAEAPTPTPCRADDPLPDARGTFQPAVRARARAQSRAPTASAVRGRGRRRTSAAGGGRRLRTREGRRRAPTRFHRASPRRNRRAAARPLEEGPTPVLRSARRVRGLAGREPVRGSG